MGIFDRFFGGQPERENENEFEVKGEKVKILEIGSTGTEIFAGQLQEEYLKDLTGTNAADIYDRMRRSDPKIKMIINAMKNPINAASWEIVGTEDEETEKGEIQRKLIEHILFNDLGKTWDRFVREALSMIEFGYSLFEVTYKAEIAHPKFGSYNGIKSLAFRSQRTIERWEIERSGKLKAVEQQAFGDKQKTTWIPADYLLHFALDMEGDNFEGISVLRPAYGPFLRKNEFLKLLAAGVEKYAIPIPTLEVPAGKEGTPEYKTAKRALQSYVSHRCNYLMIPGGWKLDLTTNTFDADKIRKVINDENVEIVNAALANFLELGQSGSGSYALGTDLSDFFLGGLEYVADQISEVINTVLIPKLVKLNSPDGIVRCELRHSGIRDKAGQELANVVTSLVSSEVIKPDDRLEESLRKRFGLPDKDESSERKIEGGIVPPPTSPDDAPVIIDEPQSDDDSIKDVSLNGAQVTAIVNVVSQFKSGLLDKSSAIELLVTSFPIPRHVVEKIVGDELSSEEIQKVSSTQLSEDDSKKKDKTEQLIDKENEQIKSLYQTNLTAIQKDMIEVAKSHFKKAEGADKFKLNADDLKKNINVDEYKKALTALLTKSYDDSFEDVQGDYKGQGVKFADISSTAQGRIGADVENIINVQVDDLAKSIVLQYGMSVESTDSPETLEQDLIEASDKPKGLATTTGSLIQASKVVNDARKDFFGGFKEEIESFTWINPSPVSDICKYLTGRTLPADHPDVERYWPPLHHNCKTYVVANTKKMKTEDLEIQDGFEPSEKELKSVTLGETRQYKSGEEK